MTADNPENPTDEPAAADGAEPTEPHPGCSGCGRPLAWESITDDWGERWLAVCDCGQIGSFFPDRRRPEQQPPEPLIMALQGHRAPRRPATPAWARLFLLSVQRPNPTHWRHHFEPCPACDSAARFGTLAWPRPDTAILCSLCLNCGHTVTVHQQPGRGQTEPPLQGSSWTPACPAVKRLRRSVLRTDPASHNDPTDHD